MIEIRYVKSEDKEFWYSFQSKKRLWKKTYGALGK